MSKDYEEYSMELGFQSCKKKSDKYTKKESQDWRTSIAISRERKGRKASKRNYGSKCKSRVDKLEGGMINWQSDYSDVDEDFSWGYDFQIKRTPLVFFTQKGEKYANKIGVIDESFTAIGDFSFNIPDELVIEILSRVPLKTLARFKCVSRKWKCLISNSVPITNAPKLLIFSRVENKCFSTRGQMFLVQRRDVSHSENKCFLFHTLDNETHDEKVRSPIKEHLLRGHTVKVHSSCHGLFLIQINNDLFMWNPLTSFFKKVLTYEGLVCRGNYFGSFVVSLCFCPANDEYKVMLIRKIRHCSGYYQYFFVATCGASSWEEIDDVDLCDVFQGPFFKGYRHWIDIHVSSFIRYSDNYFYGNVSIRSLKRIFYFDPSTNDFIRVPVPQPKTSDSDTFLSLGVLDGCLCITRMEGLEKDEGDIELLVMKEYGNGDSWEIMFVFSNTPEFRCYGDLEPLFRTKQGEILVRMETGYGCSSVKAYDVHGNFIRDIFALTNKDDRDVHDNSLNIIPYEESWFSPTKCRWAKESPVVRSVHPGLLRHHFSYI